MSDAGIAVTRQFLLESVAAHRDTGARPVPAWDSTATMIRAVSQTWPVEADWQDAAAEPITARVGKDFGYAP